MKKFRDDGVVFCAHSRDRMGCQDCAAWVEGLRADGLAELVARDAERDRVVHEETQRRRAREWGVATLVDMRRWMVENWGRTDLPAWYEAPMPTEDGIVYGYAVVELERRGFSAFQAKTEDDEYGPACPPPDGPTPGAFVIMGWRK